MWRCDFLSLEWYLRANYTYYKAYCRRPIFLCKSPFKEWFFYRETKRPVQNIRWKNGDKILNIINTFRQLWLVLFIMLHIIITLTKTPTFNENMIFFSLKCVVNKKENVFSQLAGHFLWTICRSIILAMVLFTGFVCQGFTVSSSMDYWW